jgi:hypothetical protein
MLKRAVAIAGLAIILTLGILGLYLDSKDHNEVVQIEMRPQSPPQPRPGPYEFEFDRAEEIWNRDHIVYAPSHRHMRRHKLTHDHFGPETASLCYDKDGKQITPIPKGCTDLFIERDK